MVVMVAVKEEKMTEVRIGHDQLVLPVTYVSFDGTGISFTARGNVDTNKVQKITGHQPIVLVSYAGNIIATWHADMTENFREAREFGATHITFDQHWDINYVTVQE